MAEEDDPLVKLINELDQPSMLIFNSVVGRLFPDYDGVSLEEWRNLGRLMALDAWESAATWLIERSLPDHLWSIDGPAPYGAASILERTADGEGWDSVAVARHHHPALAAVLALLRVKRKEAG